MTVPVTRVPFADAVDDEHRASDLDYVIAESNDVRDVHLDWRLCVADHAAVLAQVSCKVSIPSKKPGVWQISDNVEVQCLASSLSQSLMSQTTKGRPRRPRRECSRSAD